MAISKGFRQLGLIGIALLTLLVNAASAGTKPEDRLHTLFPDLTDIQPTQAGTLPLWKVVREDTLLGYAFETVQVVNIPAYSGKPVNVLVTLDPKGVIKDAYVLEHHEPILLVGIPEQKLFDFTAQYSGIPAGKKVVVGTASDDSTETVDAITGATVTVMVVNEAITRAAQKVALALGLISGKTLVSPGKVLPYDATENWQTLLQQNALGRLHLTRGEVDDAFRGTEAEGVDAAPESARQETFIDLYFALLTPPAIGKSLLGEDQYRWLTSELKPGDHAIAVMANGLYSFKGSGYVRGGIFDRVRVRQNGNDISFRDLDYFRLSDVYAGGMPRFSEMAIFIIRGHYEFNPAAPFALELVVRRQTGPLTSTFVSFERELALGAPYVEPAVYAEPSAEPQGPLWVQIWHQRAFQITVLSISLVLLFAIMFLQDWLVRYPRFLHNLRRVFLIYTVGFIGWYGLAQLSVVNVLTFVHALMSDFRWELFLSDPMLFILWSFTAATILLWGRGVFCGWLCPFGALQELINEAARKLKIRQFELPFFLHERLWALKYLILLGLFGISLQSMAEAERFAEVEPFKTSIMLMFQREWWFVLYAVVLLVANIFTRKVYCRYICPLGAALAIPSRFQIFQWLRRRKECGQPCQLCKVECEIQAIHPDGHINTQECHYCLDCQMTYHNPNKCPPLINKARRARKAQPAGDRIPAVELETAS